MISPLSPTLPSPQGSLHTGHRPWAVADAAEAAAPAAPAAEESLAAHSPLLAAVRPRARRSAAAAVGLPSPPPRSALETTEGGRHFRQASLEKDHRPGLKGGAPDSAAGLLLLLLLLEEEPPEEGARVPSPPSPPSPPPPAPHPEQDRNLPQCHTPSGTLVSTGVRQKVWYPASQLSQVNSLSSCARLQSPHTEHTLQLGHCHRGGQGGTLSTPLVREEGREKAAEAGSSEAPALSTAP